MFYFALRQKHNGSEKINYMIVSFSAKAVNLEPIQL